MNIAHYASSREKLRVLASCPHIWIPSNFQEVIVLYEGEKAEDTFDPLKNQIVEMPKERPAFFSKNLLQKANPHSSRGEQRCQTAAITK